MELIAAPLNWCSWLDLVEQDAIANRNFTREKRYGGTLREGLEK